VMSPGIASGTTTWRMVCHLVAPRARLALRSSWGTARSACSARAGHERQVEERQGQRAAEGREAPLEVVDEEDQAEQADHDRRHGADRFLGEADGAGHQLSPAYSDM
jgi:hypothetical protein